MHHTPFHAFIDESGNPDLHTDKSGATTHFVVAAVIVEEERLDVLSSAVDAIRAEHFGPGEIKSKSIGGKLKRRRRVAEAFAELDFGLYVLCIDKREVDKDSGLQYKKSFIKFVNGLLYRRLFQAMPNLVITPDEHGSKAFMEGFRSYVHRRHVPDLFAKAEFDFADSKAEVLIQAADFFAGTVQRCARDGAKKEERALLKLFADQIITIDDWPPRFDYYGEPDLDRSTPDEDKLIRHTAMRGARLFIREHYADAEKDPLLALQLDCLQYLLYRFRYDSPEVYVSMDELRNHLGRTRPEGITAREVRASGIAKLRDAGILIASSSKGYKLPASRSDLLDFVELSRTNIEPQLDRIARYREHLRLASGNEIDILAHPRYDRLRRVIDSENAEVRADSEHHRSE